MGGKLGNLPASLPATNTIWLNGRLFRFCPSCGWTVEFPDACSLHFIPPASPRDDSGNGEAL